MGHNKVKPTITGQGEVFVCVCVQSSSSRAPRLTGDRKHESTEKCVTGLKKKEGHVSIRHHVISYIITACRCSSNIASLINASGLHVDFDVS